MSKSPASESQGRGRWPLPIPALPGETIVKVGTAMKRRLLSAPMGQLYLTNLRLIWNPSSLSRLLRIGRLFAIDLNELQGWKVSKLDIWYGHPIVLETKEGSLSLYTYTPEILGFARFVGPLPSG